MKIASNKVVDFVVSSEKSKKNPTVFKVKRMGGLGRALFIDEMAKKDHGKLTTSILYAQRCIVGIEGLKDEDGEEVPFTTEKDRDYISTDLLAMLDTNTVNEVSVFVVEREGLTKKEKK